MAVNSWLEFFLEHNPEMKIVDRQMSVTVSGSRLTGTIAIFYEVPMETSQK